MNGIVMTLFADMIIEQHGMACWNDLLDHSTLDGIYTVGHTYPDEELLSLVSRHSSSINMCPSLLVNNFGKHLLEQFYVRYPDYLNNHENFLDFLESVDNVIHVEVMKLHPDARLPRFTSDRLSANELLMTYYSARKLCNLAEGLIAQSAAFFQVDYELQHEKCMLKGSQSCTFRITVNE